MRKNVKAIIDENIEWIHFNLEFHTIFWIGNQLGIDKCTMHRRERSHIRLSAPRKSGKAKIEILVSNYSTACGTLKLF